MVILRELKEKDALLMLEWMHDADIQKFFQRNMMDLTIEDATRFCLEAQVPKEPSNGQSIHFAIADERDEYLGTISLKNINLYNRTAEYAITTRKKVHGAGVAKKATMLLLKKAFCEYNLHRIYLNVLSYNVAAIRLYEGCGFVHEGESREHVWINGNYETLEWYGMLENEFSQNANKFNWQLVDESIVLNGNRGGGV